MWCLKRFNVLSKCLYFHVFRRMCESRQRAIVRCIKEDDSIDLAFRYSNEFLNEKQFKFHRSKNETLSRFFDRVISSINTAINKKRKKTKEEVQDITELPLRVTYNEQVLNGDTKNIDAFKDGAIFSIGETSYEISLNVPTVKSISLPSVIMVGYPIYPLVKLEFANRQESQFTWFRSITRDEKQKYKKENPQMEFKKFAYGSWLEISRNYSYVPTATDINRKLKVVCLPKCEERVGIEEESSDSSEVGAGPGICPFEDRHQYTLRRTSEDRFRCLSYNILADMYADSEFSRTVLFSYCPSYALHTDYRKPLLLKEISGYNADIMCLQEVDSSIFENDFQPYFLEKGFEGHFSTKGENVQEGIAVFYHTSKFRVINSQCMLLREIVSTDPKFEDIYTKILENEMLSKRFFARNTILQTVLLESTERPQKKVLVGNTHLYFQVDADHIRLLQATICFRYLEHQLEQYAKENSGTVPSLVFCGDFNSCPEFGIYQLATKGQVSSESEDWKSNKEEAVVGLTVNNNLKLASACGCPEYTNYTVGFKGCLDYIFYDTEKLQVEEAVPMPTDEQVQLHIALPNIVFPSDHIALICTLKWK